jgi:PAS domain S-box-containing protein
VSIAPACAGATFACHRTTVFGRDTSVPRPGRQAAAVTAVRASPVARYALAVAVAAIAVFLRLQMDPVWGLRLPYITLFPAIMLSAWLGGLWPGLVTTLLCAAAADYYWIEPIRSWTIDSTADFLGLLVFLAVGGIICGLNEAWRRGTSAVVESTLRLVESEARKAGVLEAALDCIISMDHAGRVVDFNAAAERTFGYSRSEIVGREMADLIIPPGLRERHRRSLARYLETGEAVVLDRRLELTALRADGTELPVEISIARVRVAGPPLFTAHVRDISDRQRVERERAAFEEKERAARIEAETANHLKDQFLATVSHELRAPLNAVLGWAEMLRTGVLDETRRQRALEAVYANARRQAKLIDDLLDVSRIVSGKMQVTRSAVDLAGVVRGALETVQPAAEAKGIQLETEVDAAAGDVFGDAARLQQILSNLLTNAVKFTPDAGVVRLTVRRTGNVVEMIVRDTGKGISAQFLPFVFEPFRQADGSTTRAQGGLGLGLAIVKHLVDAHGGTVAAESDGEGRGATFTVRLPIVAADADESPRPSASSHVGATRGAAHGRSLDGITVLVVEDDRDSREWVAAFLQEAHASVLTAASVTEAVAVLQRERVDVLLADIAMPGQDGYALIRKVRSMESPIKEIPAAALTSFTGENHEQRVLQAGFQLHLGKPIESSALLDAVASLASRVVIP